MNYRRILPEIRRSPGTVETGMNYRRILPEIRRSPGTDETGMNYRRSLPEIRCSPGTDETGMNFRRSLPEIRCQPRLSPGLGARKFAAGPVCPRVSGPARCCSPPSPLLSTPSGFAALLIKTSHREECVTHDATWHGV